MTTASTLLNRLMARLRLRHLDVLLRLAELGSVRRTAEAIGMSQPAVTQVLADLEALLETRLFERHARGVRPSAACLDLLPLARRMVQDMAAGAEAVAAHQQEGEGVVRVVASIAAVNGMLMQILPAFAAGHPRIQVQLAEPENNDPLLAVAQGAVDLLGCRQPAVLPEGWVFRPLVADRFVIACRRKHPLARRARVGSVDVQQAAWLLAPAGTAARHAFDALAQRWALSHDRVVAVYLRIAAATWWMLREQDLLTLVPYSVVRPFVEAGELAALDMDEPMPLDPLGTLLPVAARSAATRLARFLEQQYPVIPHHD